MREITHLYCFFRKYLQMKKPYLTNKTVVKFNITFYIFVYINFRWFSSESSIALYQCLYMTVVVNFWVGISSKNHIRRQSHIEKWKPLYLVICSSFLDMPSNLHGQFAVGDNEKNKTIVIFVFIFIHKWQTSRANVMASLKSLNKLPNTKFFIAAKKWMVRSTGVGGFIFRQNGNLRR